MEWLDGKHPPRRRKKMNRKKYLLLAILGVCGLLGAACGPASTPVRAPAMETVAVQPTAAPEAPRGAYSQESDMSTAGLPSTLNERMVIRTAQISIVVDDVEVTLPTVEGMARSMGGYIVSSSSYRTSSDRLAATVTLRIPAERFDEAMDQLRGLAGKVRSESISGEDVTDEYVDLEARLTALQATETELRALLSEVRQSSGNAQQKAQAILDIYNRLTDVRSQIEQIQGRQNYLKQMSAMATITVELLPREPEIEQPVVQEGFDPLRTVNGAARALLMILQGLLNVLIWVLIVLVPIAVIFAVPVLLIIWLVRRRHHKKNEK
jgi:hypothetical protein